MIKLARGLGFKAGLLLWQGRRLATYHRTPILKLVAMAGLEPATLWISARVLCQLGYIAIKMADLLGLEPRITD